MADKKTTPEPSGLEPGPPAYNSDESDGSTRHREVYAYTEDRKIGITGAVFLILNKMIGTGIFSTPSGVFAATGSVGISLMLWVIGGILTMCGIMTLPTPVTEAKLGRLPSPGHPKYLATCVLASQMILLGFSSGNSLAFGRYVLFASGSESPDGWAARGIAVACATFATFLHAVAPKWGLRLINVLGVFKVVILLFIVFSGFAALAGHRRVPDPDNFSNAFRIEEGDGYGNGGAYGYATALLRVVYSYKGWENANYVVGELKDPKRTLSIAAPLAVVGVTILYVLANIAYFAAIPKGQLATSEALVAGVYFRNIFAHARLNQEFAREGLLPFSRFWASNRPFNAPAAALFLHWIVTVIVLVAPPAGPAYNFIVDLYTYPGPWVLTFVCAGLIYLQWTEKENWSSPWHTYLPISVLYLLANAFLCIVPFIPPTGSSDPDGYPYYVFPVVGVGVLLLGAFWWLCWTKIWPSIGGHKIVAEREYDEQGHEVIRYKKISTRGHVGPVE
ncbi:high-affinity methionine permease [Verticillium alfalfae VaMs.102]|uniref:High-affinity methionine permease n=1 Tax=Verticillium alfalfae (strain VaMs.102 / ATCC MYA-4576 / FGSC 10136) TaxID=526221 RepID=C9SDV6_VERA1|nr:high-affinity methionine permease [Verticillium alfalfae VaMs.102]EEY17226.1 high-affinity methionine permease [Verticillium alfalfae VaMs.102]